MTFYTELCSDIQTEGFVHTVSYETSFLVVHSVNNLRGNIPRCHIAFESRLYASGRL
jgi:hypothetical protein